MSTLLAIRLRNIGAAGALPLGRITSSQFHCLLMAPPGRIRSYTLACDAGCGAYASGHHLCTTCPLHDGDRVSSRLPVVVRAYGCLVWLCEAWCIDAAFAGAFGCRAGGPACRRDDAVAAPRWPRIHTDRAAVCRVAAGTASAALPLILSMGGAYTHITRTSISLGASWYNLLHSASTEQAREDWVGCTLARPEALPMLPSTYATDFIPESNMISNRCISIRFQAGRAGNNATKPLPDVVCPSNCH
jgi:hypothetical protein